MILDEVFLIKSYFIKFLLFLFSYYIEFLKNYYFLNYNFFYVKG